MSAPTPTLYLIRHGEKDKDPSTGKDLDGLSTLGLSRSEQLVQVFGTRSPYNIGTILAQHLKKSGKRERPYQTVLPLAESLKAAGVGFDYSIDRDDAGAVAAFVKEYISTYTGSGPGQGNVLICWEHKQLNDIAKAIIQDDGIGSAGEDVPQYPDDRFDVIWTMNAPYDKIDTETSEHCTPQDDKYTAEGGWNYTTNA